MTDDWPKADVKYDNEKLQVEAQEFIDKFRKRMLDIASETLGDLYVNIMPYLETDTWTNYREALRIELQHEYKYSNFKQPWAVDFRRAVFVENRQEISSLIEQDILKRIKHLEDCKQEFEAFRYTPLGDTYQDLKSENEQLKAALKESAAEIARLKEALLKTQDDHMNEASELARLNECLKDSHDDWKRIQDAERKAERYRAVMEALSESWIDIFDYIVVNAKGEVIEVKDEWINPLRAALEDK